MLKGDGLTEDDLDRIEKYLSKRKYNRDVDELIPDESSEDERDAES